MYRGILSCVRRVARPLCWHLERKDTLSKIIIALIAVAIVALAIACGGDDSAEPAATPRPSLRLPSRRLRRRLRPVLDSRMQVNVDLLRGRNGAKRFLGGP